ncbi:transmembrane protein 130 isoform X2 [Esox lucius]|uniref:transmembrane protein 130 isoform X2 n=1 Tax=Esox lucius TaxID=8010 RepID=UPI0009733230|nr:transmembrane protein 130 isoform X2 [Esox lucius]
MDAIRTIELKGPSSFQVFRNNSLDVRVDGSLPITVCWRFVYNCIPAALQSCHLTTLYDNTLRLNHTFLVPGLHCLDISAYNNISKMQTSCSIFVWRDPFNNLLFILPCAGIMLSILAFITIVVCHPKKQQKNKPEISTKATYSSTDVELQPKQDLHEFSSDLNVSSEDNGEVMPLLLLPGERSYS